MRAHAVSCHLSTSVHTLRSRHYDVLTCNWDGQGGLVGRAHDICRLPRARGYGHGRSRTQRPDVCPLCQRCQRSHNLLIVNKSSSSSSLSLLSFFSLSFAFPLSSLSLSSLSLSPLGRGKKRERKRREKRRREGEREPDTSDYTCFELETL